MTRRRRTFAASIAAVALAFAQLAVSAHACALHEPVAGPEVMTHHESCHEMAAQEEAPVNGNVCQEHCQYGSTSVENVQPDLPAADLAGSVLRVELSEPGHTVDARFSRRLPPTAAPPPPAILFGVLRI